MADTKSKIYFGIVPKEELPGFFERLKKALTDGQKSGEKKELEIEIRGSKENPMGFSIEFFTINKLKFTEYFDPEAEHIKKALVLFTLNLEAKEEKNVEIIKSGFEILKPMIMELSFIKEKPGKYELYFRNKGTKIAIDLISVEGKIIQPLLDMGIDITEFQKFYFNLKTGADLEKMYREDQNPSDVFITELLNIFINIKSSGENIKYLIGALVAALKDVKLSNEEYQKKFEKILGFANLINIYISSTLKLEYDANVLKGEGKKTIEKMPGGEEGFKRKVSNFSQTVKGLGKIFVKPELDSLGLTDAFISLNLDTISIAVGVPKYQHGVSLVFTIPGLTYALEESLK